MSFVDVSTKPPAEEPAYLGDAVYAQFDGYHITLYTSNGQRTLDRIALEPAVLQALVDYVRALNRHYLTHGYGAPFPCLSTRAETVSESTTPPEG